MKKKMKILSVLLLLSLLLSLVPLTAFSAEAQASSSPEVNSFYMNSGAEVRTDGISGLRFTASLSKAQLQKWQSEGNVEFGVIVMPYSYISAYGDMTVENLFGDNAVYAFSEGDGKPVVDNITDTEFISLTKYIYYIRAAKLGMAPEDFRTEYSARAYVKLTVDGNVTYYMADYSGSSVRNTTRSVDYVLRAAYDYHESTVGGAYDDATVSAVLELIEAAKCGIPVVGEDITAIAVLKDYDFTSIKDIDKYVDGSAPLAWRGENESDRANIFAGYELFNIFKEIVGYELEVLCVDSLAELDSAERYFVLGAALADEAGLDYDGLTTDNGHKLVKRDGNIYLYGKSGYGTVNAVYDFLRQAFGVEFFSDTVMTHTGRIYSYDAITDTVYNPSVDYNCGYDGLLFIGEDREINYRYQLRMGFVNIYRAYANKVHSLGTLLDCETGVIYFNPSDTAVVRLVADEIYAVYGDKTHTAILLGCNDTHDEYSDTEIANYLRFMNNVVALLNTDASYSDIRDFEVMMLVYTGTLRAPTGVSASEINAETTRGVELKAMFAPIEMNMNAATDSTLKSAYGYTAEYYFGEYAKWQQIFGEDNVNVWRYSTVYSDYFMPINVIEHIGEHYREYAGEDNYIKYLIDQGAGGSGDCSTQTNYAALMVYLKGQLGKDASADVDTLVRKFCNAYYGESAGAYIYSLIMVQRSHAHDLSDTLASRYNKDISGCHYLDSSSYIYNAKYWSEGCVDDGGAMLKEWYSYIEKALAATDSPEEQARIELEAIAIRYISLRTHGVGVFSGDTMQSVEDDAISLGIHRCTEGNTIDNLT